MIFSLLLGTAFALGRLLHSYTPNVTDELDISIAVQRWPNNHIDWELQDVEVVPPNLNFVYGMDDQNECQIGSSNHTQYQPLYNIWDESIDDWFESDDTDANNLDNRNTLNICTNNTGNICLWKDCFKDSIWNNVIGTNMGHVHDGSNDYTNLNNNSAGITAEFSYNTANNPAEKSTQGCLCCSRSSPWYDFYREDFSTYSYPLATWPGVGSDIVDAYEAIETFFFDYYDGLTNRLNTLTVSDGTFDEWGELFETGVSDDYKLAGTCLATAFIHHWYHVRVSNRFYENDFHIISPAID